jgi:hypothetical protein
MGTRKRLLVYGPQDDEFLVVGKIDFKLITTAHGRKSHAPTLNKINSLLHFIRFFKTLRYFVASAFVARL